MTNQFRRPWGKRAILAVMGVVGIALVTNCAKATPYHKPIFADEGGIEIAENGPLPPIELGDSGLSVKAGRVDQEKAEFVVYISRGTTEEKTLRVGETSTVGGVRITLCATWVNTRSQPWNDNSVGSNEYSDQAYFVFSLDSSTPVCPERLN